MVANISHRLASRQQSTGVEIAQGDKILEVSSQQRGREHLKEFISQYVRARRDSFRIFARNTKT